MPASYFSPKTELRPSAIHGRGLFAAEPIEAGEIVVVKGGHILDAEGLRRVEDAIEVSYIQIGDGLFIGAADRSEIEANKLYINHSCEPNVGIRGQITFVALRAVVAGEELTYDWAMEESIPERMTCRCGTASCRGTLTGEDWKIPELQRRYAGFFSSYLAAKMPQ